MTKQTLMSGQALGLTDIEYEIVPGKESLPKVTLFTSKSDLNYNMSSTNVASLVKDDGPFGSILPAVSKLFSPLNKGMKKCKDLPHCQNHKFFTFLQIHYPKCPFCHPVSDMKALQKLYSNESDPCFTLPADPNPKVVLTLQGTQRRHLQSMIIFQFSIKMDFYQMKPINDILFNHQLLCDSYQEDQLTEDENGEIVVRKSYGKNLQKYTGKMLTAVFKDYLIYDDIFELLEQCIDFESSKTLLARYIQNQNQIATLKYNFKSHSYTQNHENIVNRPNYLAMRKDHQRIMHNNLRLKYLMKYEKRLAAREEQKKRQQKEHELKQMSQQKNYHKIAFQLKQKELMNRSKNFKSMINRSEVNEYSNFTKYESRQTLFSTIKNMQSEIKFEDDINTGSASHKLKSTISGIFAANAKPNVSPLQNLLMDLSCIEKSAEKDISSSLLVPQQKPVSSKQQAIEQIIDQQKQNANKLKRVKLNLAAEEEKEQKPKLKIKVSNDIKANLSKATLKRSELQSS